MRRGLWCALLCLCCGAVWAAGGKVEADRVQVNEGAAPTGGSGKTVIYADSSDHVLKAKVANDTAQPVLLEGRANTIRNTGSLSWTTGAGTDTFRAKTWARTSDNGAQFSIGFNYDPTPAAFYQQIDPTKVSMGWMWEQDYDPGTGLIDEFHAFIWPAGSGPATEPFWGPWYAAWRPATGKISLVNQSGEQHQWGGTTMAKTDGLFAEKWMNLQSDGLTTYVPVGITPATDLTPLSAILPTGGVSNVFTWAVGASQKGYADAVGNLIVTGSLWGDSTHAAGGVMYMGAANDVALYRPNPDMIAVLGRSGETGIAAGAYGAVWHAAGRLYGRAQGSRTTTHRQSAGTTRTLTADAAHALVAGQMVTVTFTPPNADYDGTYAVATTPASDSFTYTGPGSVTESVDDTTGAITVQATLQLAAAPTTPVAGKDVLVGASSASRTPLHIQLASAQAANAFEVSNSACVTVVSVGADGTATLSDAAGTGAGTLTTPANVALNVAASGSGAFDVARNTSVTGTMLQKGIATFTNAAGTGAGEITTVGSQNLNLDPAGTGRVLIPGAGGESVCIGPSATAVQNGDIGIGGYATSNGASYGATSVGYQTNASARQAVAFGINVSTTGIGGVSLGDGSTASFTATVNADAYALRMYATPIVGASVASSNTLYSPQQMGSSAEAILVTDQVDITQAAITNTGANWTVAVSSNVVTVNTITAHKFAINQTVTTDANWTANTFMQSLSNKVILTTPTSTTFTFALTQGNQGATTETNAAATVTPGDILLTLTTNTSFYPTECFVWTSTSTGPATLSTQPTVRFGRTAGGAEYVAAQLTSGLGTIKTRHRFIAFLSDTGGAALSAGITVPGVLSAGTVCKVRFGFKGVYARD